MVQAEFALGWLATALEVQGSKQAEWRTDPSRAGPSGVTADIGAALAALAREPGMGRARDDPARARTGGRREKRRGGADGDQPAGTELLPRQVPDRLISKLVAIYCVSNTPDDGARIHTVF